MSAKTSRLRHTKGTATRLDKSYQAVQPSGAIWDCGNFICANSKFVAFPWTTPGAVCVLDQSKACKLPHSPAMVMGHNAPVIDLQFNPFDESLLFTGSEDGTVCGFKIPDEGITENLTTSVVKLSGHGKKVGLLNFHPSASNVLATASVDHCIKLWDVEKAVEKENISVHSEQILSLNWNLDGSLVNTTCKDKKLRIIDVRSKGIVSETDAHPGSKTQRSVWAKRRGAIVTVGFNKQQYRQLMVWDIRNMAKPQHTEDVDQQSSVTMPFIDEDTNMLFLAGKGDTSIKYYEVWHENPPITPLSAFTSTDPQRGVCMVPKRTLNLHECEVARFFKLSNKAVQAISFVLPRKQSQTEFQDDVYAPTFADKAALTADEFFAGKNSEPNVIDLKAVFEGAAPTVAAGTAAENTPVKPTGGAPAPVPAPAKEEPVKKEEPAKKEEPKEEPKKEVKAPSRPSSGSTTKKPAGKGQKSPNHHPADRKSTPETKAHAPPTYVPPVELWNGNTIPTEDALNSQRQLIAALRKQLDGAEDVLKQMESVTLKADE